MCITWRILHNITSPKHNNMTLLIVENKRSGTQFTANGNSEKYWLRVPQTYTIIAKIKIKSKWQP